MYFHPNLDTGPFHMSAEEREAQKYDKPTGKVFERDILKKDLIWHLKEAGITEPKGTVKELQKQAKDLNLPTKYSYEQILPGWVGKPKGSLQILDERGWIDPDDLSSYTENGTMSEMGILRKDTSLKLLMERQQDFHAELTLLQFHAKKLGATLDRSPKCHPELAGEGIEYVWALAKLWYRRQPISLKRRKQQFHLLVLKATSRDDVLSLDKVRKCSRRAREYMLAYKAIESVAKEQEAAATDRLTHKLIEKCVKTYKSHRSAIDTDLKFVKSLENEIGKEGVSFLKVVVKKMAEFR
jgi:hypothetical protein